MAQSATSSTLASGHLQHNTLHSGRYEPPPFNYNGAMFSNPTAHPTKHLTPSTFPTHSHSTPSTFPTQHKSSMHHDKAHPSPSSIHNGIMRNGATEQPNIPTSTPTLASPTHSPSITPSRYATINIATHDPFTHGETIEHINGDIDMSHNATFRPYKPLSFPSILPPSTPSFTSRHHHHNGARDACARAHMNTTTRTFTSNGDTFKIHFPPSR